MNQNQITPHSLDHYVEDLMHYRARIFWPDYILTCTTAWTLFFFAISKGILSPLGITALIMSAFPFFRCTTFLHEIVHFRRKKILAGFQTFWTLTCGVFFFIPVFVYHPHRYHHDMHTFGTRRDPEYLPMSAKSVWYYLGTFAINLILPALIIIRFLILSPVSWIIGGRFREYILRRASTLGLNPEYDRTEPSPEERREICMQEALLLCVWVVIGTALFLSFLPISILPALYVLYVLVLTLNQLQTILEHWFFNSTDLEMSFTDQALDATILEGPRFIAPILMPTGQQYHSVHHLFPDMPYHSLKKAHYRLKAQLPSDHPYHQAIESGVFRMLIDLCKGVARNKNREYLTKIQNI